MLEIQMRNYTKIFAEMWGVYSLLWDTVYLTYTVKNMQFLYIWLYNVCSISYLFVLL